MLIFLKKIELLRRAKKQISRSQYPMTLCRLQYHLGNALFWHSFDNIPDDLEDAIKSFDEAINIATQKCVNYIYIAEIKNSLASAYLLRFKGERSRNIEEAIKIFHEISDIYSKSGSQYKWAIAQTGLAQAYRSSIQGNKIVNLRKAKKFCLKALKIITREKDELTWAKLQVNLAEVYFLYTKLKGYEFGFAYKFEIHGQNLKSKDFVASNNGGVDENKKKWLWKAMEFLELSVEVLSQENYRKAYSKDWAQVKLNLGQTLSSISTIGKIQSERNFFLNRAIECFSDSLEVFEYDTYRRLWAEATSRLGIAYGRRNIEENSSKDFSQAISYIDDALKVLTPEEVFHSNIALLYDAGMVCISAGKFKNAYDYFKTAIENIEVYRYKIFSDFCEINSNDDSLKFLNYCSKRLVDVCLKLKKPVEALEYAERSKCKSLNELFENRTHYPDSAKYSNQSIYENHCQKINWLRREILIHHHKLELFEDRDSYEFQSHTNILKKLQQELTNLVADIHRNDEDFNTFKETNFMSFQEIQECIPSDDTAIISWYELEDIVVAFIITHQDPEPLVCQTIKSEHQHAWIKALASYFVNYAIEKESSGGFLNKVFGKNKSKLFSAGKLKEFNDLFGKSDMRDKLVKFSDALPINELLSKLPPNCEQLIMIPNDSIHFIPIHAIPVNTVGGSDELLIDKFTKGINYMPSCQLLRLIKKQTYPNIRKLFAVQNPNDNLQHSNQEVIQIQSCFKESSTVLSKEKATKSTFKNSDLSKVNCLHFSCHGWADILNPLRSRIIFAQENESNDEDNNLYLMEIFQLHLSQCRLVTLAACETGLTKFFGNIDDFMSLPTGFLYAGSSCVVSSLWSVDDLATALLMMKFYENLRPSFDTQNASHQRRAVYVALNQAQTWLRDLTSEELPSILEKYDINDSEIGLDNYSSERPFSDPKFWAAFIAIGA